MLTSIDHVWGICVTNRRSTFSQWGPGGGVLDHPSNEHQYFPPPPHHSRALNERLPSQPPARLYVRPSRQQLPPWIQLQLCNNMFWHFFRGWGGRGYNWRQSCNKSTVKLSTTVTFCDMSTVEMSTVDKSTVFFSTPLSPHLSTLFFFCQRLFSPPVLENESEEGLHLG